MKVGKGALLMALGAGAVLAYQKYSEPMMHEVKQAANKVLKQTDKKLESMM